MLLAPALARADTIQDIRAQITAANDRFGPAVARHDSTAIASDYLPDGVLVPAKGPPVRGRAAIARYYAQRMDRLSRFSSIHCATQHVAYDGSAVLEEGACTFAGAHNVSRTGKFLTVWKKDSDGRWRIAINE